MPVAARRLEQDSRSYDSGGQPLTTWSAAMIRALGRDAENAAVVDILRVHCDKLDNSGDAQQYADYKIIETIKGTFEVPIQRARLSRQPTIDLRNLPQRALMFGFERNDVPAFAPLTDDTLREVRSGVAEDAVDIPRSSQSRTAGDALSCREPSGRSSASNRLTHHAEESSCPAREVLTNHKR